MFLKLLNLVYFNPWIGGNLLTHPDAIKSLSYPRAYFDSICTFFPLKSIPVTVDSPRNTIPLSFRFYALRNAPGFLFPYIILLNKVRSYGSSINILHIYLFT